MLENLSFLFDGNADHDRPHDILDFEVTFRAVLMGVVAAAASSGYSKIGIYGLE